MHYSAFSRLRDILLLCVLFFLVKVAFERTTSFMNDHKKSMVHELDRTFIDQIYTAQRQTHFIQEHYVHSDKIAHELTDIKNRLGLIEEQYKTNSPGIMLLGPIGAAAIVTKEEKLQQRLLIAVNDLSKILHIINNNKDQFILAETINSALDNNKQFLTKITV
jgi:hypothetical protein